MGFSRVVLLIYFQLPTGFENATPGFAASD